MVLNKASDSVTRDFFTTKINLNENFNRVRVGKRVSDMFPTKNGLKTRR
jgi:hypothetical protein